MQRFILAILFLGFFLSILPAFADQEDFLDADASEELQAVDADLIPVSPLLPDIKPWPYPDLIVQTISYPAKVGNTMRVNVTVANVGKTAAPASLLLFRDNNFQSSQTRQIGPLNRYQSAVVSFPVSYPENQGPWYFSAFADYGKTVRESNEQNNGKTFYEY